MQAELVSFFLELVSKQQPNVYLLHKSQTGIDLPRCTSVTPSPHLHGEDGGIVSTSLPSTVPPHLVCLI